MKYLIIPDVHDKVDVARRAIDQVKHDRRIFLGDFFDDWHTGPSHARVTAEFVKEILRDPDSDVLWGNHDLSYACAENEELSCSGFSQKKSRVIRSILTRDDWKRFKLHLWLQGPRRPWLLTHAGFDEHFLPDGQDLVSTVDSRCGNALRSLDDPNPFQRGRGHTILGVGRERGGRQLSGGVTWCDWTKFVPPAGADQIVGHTPGKEPKVADFDDAIAVCLDTNLRHVGVLDDGMLEVVKLKEIGR